MDFYKIDVQHREVHTLSLNRLFPFSRLLLTTINASMQAVSIITNYQDRTTRKVFCLSLEISLAHANPESVCHKFVFAGPDQL